MWKSNLRAHLLKSEELDGEEAAPVAGPDNGRRVRPLDHLQPNLADSEILDEG